VHRDIDRWLASARSRLRLGLHLGSGETRLDGLVNCDLYNPAADRKVDATDLRDFETGSVDLVEHHHLIEHLDFAQADRGLCEWARVLSPGGLLVVTCPDLLRVSLLYLRLRAVHAFRTRGPELEYVMKMLVGSQEHPGMYHKSHYDAERLRRLLPECGFEIMFTYPYPRRLTPSLLVIARRRGTTGP
jgi:predicted SAM-dependent methyltransferase